MWKCRLTSSCSGPWYPIAGRVATRPLNCGVMRTSTRCALGLGLLGLGGCAPHFETVAPEISGQISVCREPMVGLAVSYTHQKVLGDPDCSVIDATATTGEDGRFTLERARDFRFWVSMGDPG